MQPIQVPNKLMPWLQAIAAIIILALFCVVAIGPMVGWKPADVDMKETLKAVMFILVGFLFGSAVSSARKDDQNAALVAQVLPAASPPALATNASVVNVTTEAGP